MDTKQAFKDGFIEKMASLGVSPSEMDATLSKPGVKEAVSNLFKLTEKHAKIELDIGETLAGLTDAGKAILLGSLAVAPLAGGALGYSLAPRVSPEDIKATKEMAVLKEYEDAINQMKEEKNRERKALVS